MIKTILSVEDDSMTQLLNRITLEDAGVCEQIVEAYNGQEALGIFEEIVSNKKIKKEVPEVILLDLNMPVMGGWEFYENLKEKYKEIICMTKIFILTSSLNPEDKLRAEKEEYITDLIFKPLDDKNVSIIKNAFG